MRLQSPDSSGDRPMPAMAGGNTEARPHGGKTTIKKPECRSSGCLWPCDSPVKCAQRPLAGLWEDEVRDERNGFGKGKIVPRMV